MLETGVVYSTCFQCLFSHQNYSKIYEWRSTDVLRLDTDYLLKVAGGLANAVSPRLIGLNFTTRAVLTGIFLALRVFSTLFRDCKILDFICVFTSL